LRFVAIAFRLHSKIDISGCASHIHEDELQLLVYVPMTTTVIIKTTDSLDNAQTSHALSVTLHTSSYINSASLVLSPASDSDELLYKSSLQPAPAAEAPAAPAASASG